MFIDRRADGAGDPVDSRGNIGQPVVPLSFLDQFLELTKKSRRRSFMAQSAIDMAAEARTPGTKNDARRVRAGGRVPATLYGESKDALSLSLDPKPLIAVLHSESGHNRILNLAVKDGETSSVVLKDWLFDPVSDALLHVDLKRIN